MNSFWDAIRDFNFYLKWLFKVRNYIEKLERKLQETKRKKLKNISKNAEIKKFPLARFREYLPHFKFKVDFTSFCDNTHDLLNFLLCMSQIFLKMYKMHSFKLLKIT